MKVDAVRATPASEPTAAPEDVEEAGFQEHLAVALVGVGASEAEVADSSLVGPWVLGLGAATEAVDPEVDPEGETLEVEAGEMPLETELSAGLDADGLPGVSLGSTTATSATPSGTALRGDAPMTTGGATAAAPASPEPITGWATAAAPASPEPTTGGATTAAPASLEPITGGATTAAPASPEPTTGGATTAAPASPEPIAVPAPDLTGAADSAEAEPVVDDGGLDAVATSGESAEADGDGEGDADGELRSADNRSANPRREGDSSNGSEDGRRDGARRLAEMRKTARAASASTAAPKDAGELAPSPTAATVAVAAPRAPVAEPPPIATASTPSGPPAAPEDPDAPHVRWSLLKAAAGQSAARVELEHPTLGSLSLDFAFADGALDIGVLAPSVVAAVALRRDVAAIRSLVEERGGRLSSYRVRREDDDEDHPLPTPSAPRRVVDGRRLLTEA